MIYLSKIWLINAHTQLIKVFGSIDGIRDESILDSALSTPFQTFDGVDLYPTLNQKAARLGYDLIKNHPFVDGNKRIGAFAMEAYLNLNSIELEFTQEELIDIILNIAAGKAQYETLFKWVAEHIK